MSDIDDEFEELTAGLGDLSDLGGSGVVQFFAPDGVCEVSRAEYDVWVQDLAGFVITRQEPWRDGISVHATKPLIVVISVVADAYRQVAEHALAEGNSVEGVRLFKSLKDMAFFACSRNAQLLSEGANNG